jgi:hypothetical protein
VPCFLIFLVLQNGITCYNIYIYIYIYISHHSLILGCHCDLEFDFRWSWKFVNWPCCRGFGGKSYSLLHDLNLDTGVQEIEAHYVPKECQRNPNVHFQHLNSHSTSVLPYLPRKLRKTVTNRKIVKRIYSLTIHQRLL